MISNGDCLVDGECSECSACPHMTPYFSAVRSGGAVPPGEGHTTTDMCLTVTPCVNEASPVETIMQIETMT